LRAGVLGFHGVEEESAAGDGGRCRLRLDDAGRASRGRPGRRINPS
jgi:hypothetical protein